MPVSIFETLKEKDREEKTKDDRFYKKFPWIFRIVVDGRSNVGPVGDDGTATFMLPINPTTFKYSLPLSAEVTPQLGGGVIAEENGIILGQIEISGSTGFKLRHPQIGKNKTVNGEFTGIFAENSQVAKLPISGHLHFWLLANQLIEGYSFLKKNPDTNHARLELHIFKDQLHLHVIPRVFDLQRSATSETVSYRYSMRFDVVGPAKKLELPAPNARGLKEKFTDTVREIRDAIQGAQATLVDLKASLDEYRRIASSVASIITDVESVLKAGQDFIEGVTEYVNIPKQFIDNTTSLVQTTAEFFYDVLTLPADVAASFMSLGDDLDRLKIAFRDNLAQTISNAAIAYRDLTVDGKAIEKSTEVIDEVTRESQLTAMDTAQSSNGSMTSQNVFGVGPRPGDAMRKKVYENRINDSKINGFKEVVLNSGDSLESLAARHLGDAGRWIEIAIMNDLEAPYISAVDGIPNTVKRGDRIIIPQSVASAHIPEIVASTGNAAGQSQVSTLLGKEFLLEPTNSNGQLSWVIDEYGGKIDIKTTEGIDDLSQGILVRLSTERGDDICNPSLGLPRNVGVSQLHDIESNVVFSVREEILADPRVEKIISINIDSLIDGIDISANVQPKGFSSSTIIKRRVA